MVSPFVSVGRESGRPPQSGHSDARLYSLQRWTDSVPRHAPRTLSGTLKRGQSLWRHTIPGSLLTNRLEFCNGSPLSLCVPGWPGVFHSDLTPLFNTSPWCIDLSYRKSPDRGRTSEMFSAPSRDSQLQQDTLLATGTSPSPGTLSSGQPLPQGSTGSWLKPEAGKGLSSASFLPVSPLKPS